MIKRQNQSDLNRKPRKPPYEWNHQARNIFNSVLQKTPWQWWPRHWGDWTFWDHEIMGLSFRMGYTWYTPRVVWCYSMFFVGKWWKRTESKLGIPSIPTSPGLVCYPHQTWLSIEQPHSMGNFSLMGKPSIIGELSSDMFDYQSVYHSCVQFCL